MRFYIAGPISGHPQYKREFANAARRLQRQGHDVLNPAVIPTNTTPEDAMLICLPMLIQSEAVYFLKGWEESKGSIPEFALAKIGRAHV